jgi:hypothetical protein
MFNSPSNPQMRLNQPRSIGRRSDGPESGRIVNIACRRPPLMPIKGVKEIESEIYFTLLLDGKALEQ